MKFKSLGYTTGLFLLGFCTTHAGAVESGSIFSLSLEELLNVEVTTSSRYRENIVESPANIHVFSKDKLRSNNILNIEDLLLHLPGVQVQKYSILGTYNTVTFRGSMGNNKFLILQDGVRLSSPAGERTAITHNYPLYYAKKVEVLMGPASVVYGADAFMGVINIITHDTTDKDSNEVSLTAGTDNYGHRHLLAHNNLGDSSFYNVGIQAFRSNDYKFHEDFPELYDDPLKSYDMKPTRANNLFINYQLNKQWRFGFTHSNLSNTTDFTAKPSFSQFDPGTGIEIHQTTAYARYEVDLSKQLKSTTLLTLVDYELDNQSYFNNLFTGGNEGYKYAHSERVSVSQELEFELNDSHRLSGGVVYDSFEVIPQGPDLPSPYDTSVDPDNQMLLYPNTGLPIVFFERDYDNKGIYFQDNWKIDQTWRLVMGVRYDDNSFYGDSTNPRLSLIHKADDKNLYKILYGEAFLAPAPDLYGTSFGSFTNTQNGSGEWISAPSRFRVPNPALKPEKIKTLEFNYEHWFSKNSKLKLAPYYSEIDDVILLVNDAVPDQAIPGAELQATNKNDNVGNSTIYGLDISFNNQSTISEKELNSWINIGYMDGELINNGQETVLPMTAEFKISAGATVKLNEKHQLTTLLFWVDETYSNQPDPADSSMMLQVPSYYYLDMHYVWNVKDNFEFKAGVFNLLDKKYSNAPFPPPFIAFNEAPQNGRIVTLGLSYKF